MSKSNAKKNTPAAKTTAPAKVEAAAKTTAPAKVEASVKTVAKAQTRVDAAETLKITGILTAICVVITALLAGTNALTAEKIAEGNMLAKQTAWHEVVAATDYIPVSQCDVRFSDYDAAVAVSGADICGLVVTTVDKGYGGEITVLTGFDRDGAITGVQVLEHSETPGLGANAEKSEWLSQFITPAGETRRDSYEVTKDGGTIDAVTAATKSSRAVTRAVNSAIDIYIEVNSAGTLAALPEWYVPTLPAAVSPSDTTTAVSAEEDAPAEPQPTILAGGDE